AADERGLHALGAHGDPVGDGDRVELDRRAAVGPHALGDLLGELAVVRVARRELDPAVGDPDQRAREVLVGEPDGAEVRARGRPIGPIQQHPTLVTWIKRHGRPPSPYRLIELWMQLLTTSRRMLCQGSGMRSFVRYANDTPESGSPQQYEEPTP